MVPLRVISEGLGADVDWDGDARIVTVVYDGKTIELPIGVRLEGMDVPAEIIDGRTMVPVGLYLFHLQFPGLDDHRSNLVESARLLVILLTAVHLALTSAKRFGER